MIPPETVVSKPARESETLAINRAQRAPLAVLLRVVGARAEPATVRLDSAPVVLGAGGQADVIIDSPTVSRRHVEIALVDEGARVSDLGSRNGTFYLGQRIESMVLAPGSRFVMGSVEVSIEADLDALESGPAKETSYRGLLGSSPEMRRLFATLLRLEGSLVNVLVSGESGVGKEVVARALHEGSRVAKGPLVAKNCGTMTKELVQSELFGHKRGAFTHAVESRPGAFQAADGGTLFLDEIGELALEAQPALLRALEAGEVTPVGATTPTKVKVRVIAATNRNLEEQVRAGSFREDLYYRLAVVKLKVPPLRERAEDIDALARLFAKNAGISELPEDVVAVWRGHDWPGNARELRNAVDAFAALGELSHDMGAERRSSGGNDASAFFQSAIDLEQPFMKQREAFAEQFTRAYLLMLLSKTQGNQSEASRLSGVERSHFRRLLAKHGLLK